MDFHSCGAFNGGGAGFVVRHPTEPRYVFVVGAARSGTKLLRDSLAVLPGVARVPFDVNYLWRLGNERCPHDELRPEMLTSENRSRIRQRIDMFRKGQPVLVEKTVSNALRLPFVKAVFPSALVVHLVRDGNDAAESAYRQWQAPPDARYIVEKARAFPISEAPRYALRYGLSTLRRVLPGRRLPPTWGPRYNGIDADVAALDLVEVCARQWARCVEQTLDEQAEVASAHMMTVRYEEFVSSPREQLAALAEFIGLRSEPTSDLETLKPVADFIGRGWSPGSSASALALPHMERALRRLGYSAEERPAPS